jgi:hypothetical protein
LGASILLLVVVVGVVLGVRWLRSSTAGATLVAEVDLGPDWTSVGVTTPYQRQLAYQFKAEFGELRYNKANRIIAGDWCRKAMADNDVRLTDRVRLLPLAVELCLLPTRHAVQAAELAATYEVRHRRAAADLPK